MPCNQRITEYTMYKIAVIKLHTMEYTKQSSSLTLCNVVPLKWRKYLHSERTHPETAILIDNIVAEN